MPREREREPSGPKHGPRGPDLVVFVGAVIAAVIFSGSLSVYVASKFLDEYKHKLERMDKRIEDLDNQSRSLRNEITRTQTQIETQDDTTVSGNLHKLDRRTDALEAQVETLNTNLVEIENKIDNLRRP